MKVQIRDEWVIEGRAIVAVMQVGADYITIMHLGVKISRGLGLSSIFHTSKQAQIRI